MGGLSQCASPDKSCWACAKRALRGDVHGLVRTGWQVGSMLLCAMDGVLFPPEFPTWEPNSQRADIRKGGWVLGVSSPSGLVLL